MSQSIKRNFLESPFQVMATYDVAKVRSILLNLEQSSQFRDAAILCDAMMRDDRIAGVLETRVLGMLSLPLEFQVPESLAKTKARQLQADLQARWDEMFPEGVKEELLRWRILLGVGLAELCWEPGAQWTPRIKVWHPQFLRYDQTSKQWLLQTADAGEIQIQPGDGKWFLFTSGDRPWTNGAIRRLALLWLIRQYAFRDWARRSEVLGMPIFVGKVPAKADKNDKARYLRDLRQLGAESKILAPQGESKESSYGLELVEAMANNHLNFKDLIAETNTSIAVTLLGNNLSTEVKGGSHAAASVHDRIRQEYMEADALAFGKAIQQQVLTHWVKFNYGHPVTPFPAWDANPPADQKAEAETLNVLGDALGKLKGIGVDISPILDQKGLKLLPEAPTPTGPAPAPTQQHHGLGVKLIDNVLRLASGAPTDQNSGFLNGQLYADSLVDQGLRLSRTPVDAVRAVVLQAVDESTSYEDLRNRLVATFGNLDPDLLRPLIERALILGQLAGMNAVQEDV